MDNKQYLLELQQKITDGLKLSAKKLLGSKKQNDSKLAIYRDGKIIIIKAAELR